uniref:DUF19 domain-containing protein n=1 Tax=Panagrolaimus sp. ES5 TaxID=591445 RepID=A0AC34FIJ6_9BILA
MKNMFLFLSFLALFFLNVNGHLKGHCSSTSRMTMERCYHDYFKSYAIGSDEISVETFNKKLEQQLLTWKGVENVCQNFNGLKKCIGSEIAYDCMNLENFNKLTIALEEKAAETYVSHFFTTNYACNDGFKKLQSSFECYKNIGIHFDASTLPTECSSSEAEIDAMAKKVEEACDKTAADFAKTYKRIELCHILPDCNVCKKQLKNRHKFFLKWV